MKFTTKVGVVLLLVAGMSIIVGAGSFTSTEAGRPVNVSVVDDESAYIGFDISDQYRSKDNMESGSNDEADYNVTLRPDEDNGDYQEDHFLSINLGIIEANLLPGGGEEGYKYDDVIRISNRFTEELTTTIDITAIYEEETYNYEDTTNITTGDHESLSLTCKSSGDDLSSIIGGITGGGLDGNPSYEQNAEEYELEISVEGETDAETGEFERTVKVVCEEYDQGVLDAIL